MASAISGAKTSSQNARSNRPGAIGSAEKNASPASTSKLALLRISSAAATMRDGNA